jgi:glycosyltransferase involved in cell wall biosynthesis
LPNRGALFTLVSGREAYGVGPRVVGLVSALRCLDIPVIAAHVGDGPLVGRLRDAGANTTAIDADPPPDFAGNLATKMASVVRLMAWERHAEIVTVRKLVVSQPILGIHVVWPNLVGLAGRLGRRLGVPTLWEMPFIVTGRGSQFWYQFVTLRHNITTVGGSTASARSLGSWPVRAHHQPYGVDPARVTLGANTVSRSSLGLSSRDIVFAIIARIIPEKAQLEFVRSLGRLTKEIRARIVVLIVGDGSRPYVDAVREAARIGDVRTMEVGYQKDVAPWLEIADVVVSLRRTPEAFGLSVVEGMLAGRPTLVAASGGPSETVVDGVTGWHLSNLNDLEILEGVYRCLRDRERWTDMGAAAKLRAMKLYSNEAYARRLLESLEAH